MSAAYDIASYIATTLAKGTLGTTIFVNGVQDTPDDQIVVYEYGGAPSDLGMGSANADALENVNVQVYVRDNDSSAAYGVIYAIYKALDGLCDVTINSVAYLFMRALQPPFIFQRDSRERTAYVFNMRVQKRRS